ncbi:GTP 3',8-cyclase MoaA [Desulfohalovibrio reitneri]|uniref:GTP 3',8-cyclase MoaA n=1 Tax=Desulfohalovibrio reitneri TaxID=1307759 RepID=UPI0004A74C12|nr:GTP 3',8-cyclase MoaA [Desulfohalovibrio reitneri]
MNQPPDTDRFGRRVSYLRLSVTDRCNLRCAYCFRRENITFLRHEDILRYEEMLSIIEAAVSTGVDKVRLTGGEPLVRRDFLWFMQEIGRRFPGLDLRLTTNATLLSGKVDALRRAGLSRVNISIDSLDRSTYALIAGRDFLPQVMSAVSECLDAGLTVKLNAVALRGVSDREMPAFLELARDRDLDIRFIECMPVGEAGLEQRDRFIGADELLELASNHVKLSPVPRSSASSGPARVFSLEGGRGRLGLISPMTNHFCRTCNRLRVTADGHLRTCLFSDRSYLLRPALHHPRLGVEGVARIMRAAARNKPVGHDLLRDARVRSRMSAVGG